MHSQPRYFVISAPIFDGVTPLDPAALAPKGANPGGGSNPIPSQNQPRIAATLTVPTGRFSIRSLLRPGNLGALVRIRCITPASGSWQLRSAAAGEQIDPPPIDQPLTPVRPLTQEWSDPVEAGTTDAVVVLHDFEGPVQPQIEIEVSEFAGELAVAVLAAKSKTCCEASVELTDEAPTQLDVGDGSEVGVATTAARADHQHRFPAPGAPANVTKAPASAGASSKVAREDHKHDIDTGVPVTVRGANNQEGTATSLARSDHKHRNEVQIQKDGALVGARPTLNFIGDGVTVADDNVQDRLDITIDIPSGVGGILDLSVNSAKVDGVYSDGTIVLRTGSRTNTAGSFQGGGLGNKAILGTENLQGDTVGEVSLIEYRWKNLVGPANGTVLAPYWNLIVDWDPGGLHDYKVLSILAEGLNPAIVAVLGTETANIDGSYTMTWDAAIHCVLVVGQTPPFLGVAPAVSVGPLWTENAYRWTDLVAARPNAIFTKAFTGDGGLPAGSMVASGLLVSGDSNNLQKSGKHIFYWTINGLSAY